MRKMIFVVICFAVVLLGALLSTDVAAGGGAPAEGAIQIPENLLDKVGDNSGRAPYHADSLAALAVIVLGVILMMTLNHAKMKVRVFGVAAASLMCFALFAAIVAFDFAGVLDNPRPPVLPFDEIKAPLLRLQAFAALITGVFLVFVMIWQTRRDDVLVLAAHNEAARYGRVSRYLHWLTAVLFLVLVPMGLFMTILPEDTFYRHSFYVVHKSLGFTVLLLVLARLGWHYFNPRPPLAASLKVWERRLAHSVHVMLYVFLLAFPVSGFVMSTFAGKLSHFYFWDLPLFWPPDPDALIPPGLIHKVIMPYLFYVLIVLHVLGAMKHQFIDKQPDGFRRMVS